MSLEEVSVSGSSDVGGLVGYNRGGTITNSYSSGSVSGDGVVGGLVGSNYEEQSQIHTGTFTGLVEAIVWVRVQAVVAQVKIATI